MPGGGPHRPWLLDQVPSYQGAFTGNSALGRGGCAVGLPRGKAYPSRKEPASFLRSEASPADKAATSEAVIHYRGAGAFQIAPIQGSDCFHYLICAGQRCPCPACSHQHPLRFFEGASRLSDGRLKTRVASSCPRAAVL